MTDLHALIRRMADELDHYRMLLCDDRTDRHPLAAEARAALAADTTTEPLLDLIEQLVDQLDCREPLDPDTLALMARARAVLAADTTPTTETTDD